MHIYMCVCVCVCVCDSPKLKLPILLYCCTTSEPSVSGMAADDEISCQ